MAGAADYMQKGLLRNRLYERFGLPDPFCRARHSPPHPGSSPHLISTGGTTPAGCRPSDPNIHLELEAAASYPQAPARLAALTALPGSEREDC